MKKFITLALAAVIAISANAKKVNTAVFNSVKVNAPVHLVIVPSREYSVDVTSRESDLASAISWSIKDGVLNISARDLETLEQANGTVDVIVSAPQGVDYTIQRHSGCHRISPTRCRLHDRSGHAASFQQQEARSPLPSSSSPLNHSHSLLYNIYNI